MSSLSNSSVDRAPTAPVVTVQEIMGSIPVGDSDGFVTYHVDQFTFRNSLSSLKFTIFIHLPLFITSV